MTTSVQSVAHQSPELALLASVVQLAVSDAKKGDVSARLWLRGPECLRMLATIAPPGIDPRALQERLIIMKLEGEE